MFVMIIFMSICFIFLPILLCMLCDDNNYVYTHRCSNCNQVMYVKNPPVRKNTTHRRGGHGRVHNMSSHHHGSRSNRIHNTHSHNNFGRRDSDNSIISSISDMEMNHTRHRMHWYSFHHFYFIYLCQKLLKNRDLFKK